MIDIGANLTNRRFQKDLPQVISRASEAGVEAILVTGTSMPASHDAIRLVHRLEQNGNNSKVELYSTVGVHPHDAKHFDEKKSIDEMRELIFKNPGTIVAVGECGLDFNRDFSPRDVQERVFRAQVELACELKMPLFLHERESHTTFLKVLQPFLDTGRLPPVVVHCFTGTEAEVRKYLSMGFYIGITGFICIRSRGFKLRSFASVIPPEKLLIETDAPFMYPYGNNKRERCEPKDICAVVDTLATCMRLSSQEIASITTQNSRRFFRLDYRFSLKGKPSHITPPAAPSTLPNESFQETNNSTEMCTRKASNHDDYIAVDGGQGEGGGQVLRISIALAGIFGKAIRIHSIRKNRSTPGLRNQHLQTLELAKDITNGKLEQAQVGSTEVFFSPNKLSKENGTKIFSARSNTGGAISLIIQGSLPICLFSPTPVELKLGGGTNVGFSPPIDFMQTGLKILLERFGIEYDLEIFKRGFLPIANGQAKILIKPIKQLTPIDISRSSQEITNVSARVVVYGEEANETLAQQYVDALKLSLQNAHIAVLSTVDTQVIVGNQTKLKNKKKPKKNTSDICIQVLLQTKTGGLLSIDRTERKESPQAMSEHVTSELKTMLERGYCLDEHLADNAIVYMALAKGTSRIRVPRKADLKSKHLPTALALVNELTGSKWKYVDDPKLSNAIIEVEGIGYYSM
jgi:RNA 3'-phosphate cyclase